MKTLEEAVAQLAHEPDRIVVTEVNGLVVELRCKARKVADDASAEQIPDRPLSELRGFLKGVKTEGFREKKDRI